MVINLQAGNLTDQSPRGSQSHDQHTIRSTSWLSVSDVFSLTVDARQRGACSDFAESDVNSYCCDMQVNVPLNSSSVPQTNVLHIAASENGVNNNASTQIHNSMFQNINETNLSSANVVGLPNHARYSSVPVSTIQSRSSTNNIVPKHSRNISEPSNQFFKCQNNNITTPQPGSSVPVHYRHSTQVDHSNVQQMNNFRSQSVPKCVPIPRYESSITTATNTVPSTQVNNPRFTQKINTNNDISNVNVNFYRAVPVNVISSVPTIHCLNTLSNVQGNEVSNVQVLPLGNPNVNNSNLVTSSTNNSLVVGTTQVILHNTQGNSINNDKTNFLNLQTSTVNVSTGCTSTATNTVTNLFPPSANNQVIVQNTRPVNFTTIPFVNNTQQANTSLRANIQVGSSNQVPLIKPNNENRTSTRTFTSTEAQTDEISILPPTNEQTSSDREQRRRERRERRHQRRINNRQSVDTSTQVNNHNDRLPDILNSHLPPPYTTLSNGQSMNPVVSPMSPLMTNSAIVPSQMMPPPHGAVLQTVVPSNIVPTSGFVFQGPPPVGQVPLVQGPAPVAVPVPPPTGFRFPFPANGFRRFVICLCM